RVPPQGVAGRPPASDRAGNAGGRRFETGERWRGVVPPLRARGRAGNQDDDDDQQDQGAPYSCRPAQTRLRRESAHTHQPPPISDTSSLTPCACWATISMVPSTEL